MRWKQAARALAVCFLLAAQGAVWAGEPGADALEHKARKLAAKGDYAGAYMAAEQAVARRPNDAGLRALAETYQRQAQIAMQLPGPSAAPGPEQHVSLPAASLEDRRELAPPPALEPEAGRHDFDLLDNSRALIEKVTGTYGIRAVFDSDFPPLETRRRLKIDQADWEDAIYALQLVTGSFYVPVNSKLAMFVKETAVKRGEVEPTVTVAVPFPETMSAQDLQDVINAVRQVFGLTKVAIDATQHAMVLRDRVSRVRPAMEIVRQLMHGPGEVYIDVDLLEVDNNLNTVQGLDLPTSYPIVDFASKVGPFKNVPYIPAGFTNFLTWGGGATYLGVGVLSTTLTATLSASKARSITSTSLRGVNGQAASIHIGERYPIVQQAFVSPGGNNSPTVSSLAPSSEPAGSGTLTLVIRGANFASDAIVYWILNGAQTTLTSSYVNSTQLNATVPASLLAAQGTATVEVQNGSGGATASATFIVTPATEGGTPSIGSLLPAATPAGGGAFSLVIAGANFTGTSTVVWTAGGAGTALSHSYVNSTQLVASVPADLIASAGEAAVSVQNGSGAVSPPSTFTVNPAASLGAVAITSLAPVSATSGGGAFTLQVTGANCTQNSVLYWTLGGTATPLATTYVNFAQLTASVPQALLASAGIAQVTVIDPASGTSPASAFTITGPAIGSVPAINSFSPSSAPAGAASFALLISGSNFSPVSYLNWTGPGGAGTLQATYINSTQLAVTLPASVLQTAGNAQISVLNAAGTSSALATFTITPAAAAPAPAVTSLSPPSAAAGSGDLTLIVGGANFTPDAAVYWTAGGASYVLATSYVNAARLSATVGAGLVATAGSATIMVQSAAGNSAPVTFTVNTASSNNVPVITGLTPSSATAGDSAFTLIVAGANFTSTSNVLWTGTNGQTQLSVTFINSTQVRAAVTADLVAEAGSAEVYVDNGNGAVSAASPFTINPPANTTPTQPGGITIASGYTPSIQFEDLGISLKLTPHVHDAESLTLECEAEFTELTGETNIGIPVIANRKFTTTARMRFGEAAIIAGLMQETRTTARTGLPGLHWIPWMHQDTKTGQMQQALLILRPRLTHLPPAEYPAGPVWTGTEVRSLPLDYWDWAVAHSPGIP